MAHHRDPGARDPGGDCTVRALRVRCLSAERMWSRDVCVSVCLRVCMLVPVFLVAIVGERVNLFAEQHLTTPSEHRKNTIRANAVRGPEL